VKRAATSFKDLEVWQKAHALVLDIYRLTANFPDHERYGLRSQMQRAAVSIPANIAEGFRKHGAAEKARFYNISQCSLEETRYYLILAQDLKYGGSASLLASVDTLARMLNAYIRSMRSRHA